MIILQQTDIELLDAVYRLHFINSICGVQAYHKLKIIHRLNYAKADYE